MKMVLQDLRPLLILFVLVLLLGVLGTSLLNQFHLVPAVILIANLLLFLLGCVSYNLQKKAASNSNPHAFVRSVMSSMLLKMAVIVAFVAIYVVMNRTDFSKTSVVAAMVLYLVYLAVEVKLSMRYNQKKK